MFFMSLELKKIMAMLALLESTEFSHISLGFFLHYYQCFHKSIYKKIAQKIARSWSCDRDRIADGFSNWDRDRDRDLNF